MLRVGGYMKLCYTCNLFDVQSTSGIYPLIDFQTLIIRQYVRNASLCYGAYCKAGPATLEAALPAESVATRES